MNISFGKMLIITGITLVVIGAVFTYAGKVPWLGKLPGDICIQKKGLSVYFPITTSIIISIILSLVLILIRKR